MTTLSLAINSRSDSIESKIKAWVEGPIKDPLRELDDVYKSFSELPEGLKEKATQLQREALYFLSKTTPHTKGKVFLAEKIFYSLITMIEAIFAMFGLEALLSQREYEWQDENKSYMIMGLISFIGTLSTIFVPLMGGDAARKKFAIGLTALMGMSLIYPHFKPTPRSLPRGLNLSEKIRNGEVSVVEGDKKVLSQMASAINARKKVLLVGPSGAGKTETAKAFVEAVERGDYPELKHLTSFYYNTADILDGPGLNLLPRIKALVGRNREKLLFIWDEFHAVCKSPLADQMKTSFDPGPQGQPYAIVITTDEEIKAFEKGSHGALLRRFERIEIRRCSDEQALNLLPPLLLRKMPEAIVLNPENVFRYIIDECKSKLPADKFIPYQVHNALEVLNRCLELTGEAQFAQPDSKSLNAEKKIQAQLALKVVGAAHASFASQENPGSRDLFQSFQKQKMILAQKESEIKALFLKRRQLLLIKKHFYETALKIAQSQGPSKRDLVKFHLIGTYIEKLMQEAIAKKGDELEIKMVIDKSVVNQAIEEIASQRSVDHS